MARGTVWLMGNVFGRVLCLVLAVSLLAACSEDKDPASLRLEGSLQTGYLHPLADAGIDYEVLDTCQYDSNRADTGTWQFAIQIHVDATPEEVTAALTDTVDQIEVEEGQTSMQQEADDPEMGWSGSMSLSGDGVQLDLTNHHANVGSTGPRVGWQEICPDSMFDEGTSG